MHWIEDGIAVFGPVPAAAAGVLLLEIALMNFLSCVWFRNMMPIFAQVTWEQYLGFFAAPLAAAMGGAGVAVGLDRIFSDKPGTPAYNTGEWLFLGSVTFMIAFNVIALHSLQARPTALTFRVSAALLSGNDIEGTLAAIDKAKQAIAHPPRPKRWILILLGVFAALAVLSAVPPFAFYDWYLPPACVVFLAVAYVIWRRKKQLDARFKMPTLIGYEKWLTAKRQAPVAAKTSAPVVACTAAGSGSAVDWRVTTGLLALGAVAGSLLGRRRAAAGSRPRTRS
jgi:hypothetical protein